MRKLNLLFMIFSIGISACNDKDKDEPISGSFPSKNFVQVYIVPEDIQINQTEQYIRLVFKGNSIDNWTAKNEEQFDELSTLYHDKSYNQNLVPYSNQALSQPLQYLSITSEADFEGFPKGETINQLVTFYAYTAYPFIQSSYNENVVKPTPDNLKQIIWGRNNYSFVSKRINDLTSNDVCLLFPVCYMELASTPLHTQDSVKLNMSFRVGDKNFQKEFYYKFEKRK